MPVMEVVRVQQELTNEIRQKKQIEANQFLKKISQYPLWLINPSRFALHVDSKSAETTLSLIRCCVESVMHSKCKNRYDLWKNEVGSLRNVCCNVFSFLQTTGKRRESKLLQLLLLN